MAGFRSRSPKNLKNKDSDIASKRAENLNKTLQDLKCMKKDKKDKNCFSDDQCTAKSVRFKNLCLKRKKKLNTRKTCSAGQIHVPLWMRNESLRNCYSECSCDDSMLDTSEACGSSKVGRLKKFWRSISPKHKSKKQSPCSEDYDSGCSVSSKRGGTSSSCANSISCEKEQNMNPFDCTEVWKNNCCQKSSQTNILCRNPHEMCFNDLKSFWEPKNGLNNVDTLKKHASSSRSCSSLLENLFAPKKISSCELRCQLTDDCICYGLPIESREISPQSSTETLTATQTTSCYTPSTYSQSECQSQCNGFLNYKTSPICCSLDSTGASCEESESDTTKTIRLLKREMALRKRLQKLELKQLKEEMRFLNGKLHRKSSTDSTACSRSSVMADSGSSSKNSKLCSHSSHSSPVCSVYSVRSSDERFRTVLSGHPCRSIPKGPCYYSANGFNDDTDFVNYINCSQPVRMPSKCSQLKQQYAVKSPCWTDPVLCQKQTPCMCPKKYSRVIKRPSSGCNCSYDPTSCLWNQIIINTPCCSRPENDSIITSYVNMYRFHAAEALKKRKTCVIDPLEFRYGYQNGVHNAHNLNKK